MVISNLQLRAALQAHQRLAGGGLEYGAWGSHKADGSRRRVPHAELQLMMLRRLLETAILPKLRW